MSNSATDKLKTSEAYAKWYIARKRRWPFLWFMPWVVLIVFYFFIAGIEYEKVNDNLQQSRKELSLLFSDKINDSDNIFTLLVDLTGNIKNWDLYSYCRKSKVDESILKDTKPFTCPYIIHDGNLNLANNNSYPDFKSFNWHLPGIMKPGSPVMLYLNDNKDIINKALSVLKNKAKFQALMPEMDAPCVKLMSLSNLLLFTANYFYTIGDYSKAAELYLSINKLGHLIGSDCRSSSLLIAISVRRKVWRSLLFQLYNTPPSDLNQMNLLIDNLYDYPYFNIDLSKFLEHEKRALLVEYDSFMISGLSTIEVNKKPLPTWLIAGITCNSSARQLFREVNVKTQKKALDLINTVQAERDKKIEKYSNEMSDFYRYRNSPELSFYSALATPIPMFGSSPYSILFRYYYTKESSKIYYLACKALIYYYKHGKWPKNQFDLGVKKEIVDAYSSKKMPIQLEVDQDNNLKIWSVGFDGVDNGGKKLKENSARNKRTATDYDVGFILQKPQMGGVKNE